MGILLSAGSALASENRYHPNHLFIKMKDGESLIKSSLIRNSKNIIGDLYLVETRNADKLAQKLEAAENIEYVQRDYYAGQRKMPKLEPLDPWTPYN